LTHKQCPRKYFYRYIEKLPGPKSIHLIRGSVIHKVLEDIYDIDITKIPVENFFYTFSVILQEKFRQEWFAAAPQLAELGLSPEELDAFFEESQMMVDNFFHHLHDQMEPLVKKMSPYEAFKEVTPQREIKMKSAQHLVRGYIDVITEETEGTIILDYKTSKKLMITPEYRLQLGIYAMMHEEYQHAPHEVGVIFLKHGQELRIPVTPELIEDAKKACSEVQLQTRSIDLNDYPKKPSPLCKWRTGQCEYHDICFMGLDVPTYRTKMKLKR
ncbi:PD-(D/E)XK nuclease family protein, partial [Candidatus Woesearchaeota archaeon]|nr:PD-(D/E)XK nuclease family protein [Candidatus Woesearchaeota archaeon]